MKFKVGDTVRRTIMCNRYADGRCLHTGTVGTVVNVCGISYIDVIANDVLYDGCDSRCFELVDTIYPEHMNCKCSVNPLAIKDVIFNPPATIILWNDGTKSVVKCQNGEPYDAEKGFALAYLKKLLGNDNTFNKEINKWVTYEPPKVEEVKPKDGLRFNTGDRVKIIDNLSGHSFALGTIVTLEKWDYDYKATSDNGISWWVVDDDLELVKE